MPAGNSKPDSCSQREGTGNVGVGLQPVGSSIDREDGYDHNAFDANLEGDLDSFGSDGSEKGKNEQRECLLQRQSDFKSRLTKKSSQGVGEHSGVMSSESHSEVAVPQLKNMFTKGKKTATRTKGGHDPHASHSSQRPRAATAPATADNVTDGSSPDRRNVTDSSSPYSRTRSKESEQNLGNGGLASCFRLSGRSSEKTNSQMVRFDTSFKKKLDKRSSYGATGRYVDELAMTRAHDEKWEFRIARTNQAIMQHRDSLGNAALTAAQMHQLAMARGLGSGGRQSSKEKALPTGDVLSEGNLVQAKLSIHNPTNCPKIKANMSINLLRRIGVFQHCSDNFLGLIASTAEHLHLKTGEVRDMDGARVGVSRVRPAVGIIVESGSFRIEISHSVVEECNEVGSCFGLANVLVSASMAGSRCGSTGAQAPVDFMVRASGSCPEGYRIMMFHSTGVRQALQECPADHAQLREVLHVMSQPVNSTNHFVTLLHCSESAKAAITESTTRHILTPGEYIARENQRSPDGIVFLRSGTVALEINGVEVRRISKGQAMGEELLFGVSRKWSVSARCTTLCDVVVLHRRLFTTAAKDMYDGSTEDRRESERLMIFLEGHWKDDKLILSWPLFRGFDQDLLATLAHLVETRVLLPNAKLWETGGSGTSTIDPIQAVEVALYVLRSGACEETSSHQVQKGHHGATEVRTAKRPLVPGCCIGTLEFLGLQSQGHLVVKARSLCIVAVLHRAVFLKAVDNYKLETPQATEITGILKDELDKKEPEQVTNRQSRTSSANDGQKPPAPNSAIALVGFLPTFRTHDKVFIDGLCSTVCKRRLCIAGQAVCSETKPTTTMYVFVRGRACLIIADLHIKEYVRGEAFNMLALAANGLKPSYTVRCARTSEFWSISRDDFKTCLETFPTEQGRFTHWLRAPSDLEIQAKRCPKMTETSGACGTSETPSNVSVNQFTLRDIPMFHVCSSEFLQWIAAHLQAAIYFTDDIIVSEGGEDASLYIIRHGSIIKEGTETLQGRKDTGSIIGKHRLLGIAQKSHTTNQAIELSVVQILHQSVFQKALELFPDQIPHFDKLILAQMDGVSSFEIHKAPFFESCSRDFCRQVERVTLTRLVHPGSILLEEGSDEKVIRIIKSGAAIVLDEKEHLKEYQPGGALYGLNTAGISRKAWEPTKISDLATLNADVVLGSALCVTSTVRAERLCAVGEIEGAAFISILQRFPQEIVPLITAASGAPWPTQIEAVPFLKGVNYHLFDQLIERSTWLMLLPDQCVVKQGGRGDILFLLCYGFAVEEVDGVVIGDVLTQGACFGKPNFFGLTKSYSSTVRTSSVCHFRTVAASVLAQLMLEHVAERERFASLKLQVQAEATERERKVKEVAGQEKLRRREEVAFRGHISRERDNRGLSSLASTSSLAFSLQEQLLQYQDKHTEGFLTSGSLFVDSVEEEDKVMESSPPVPVIRKTMAAGMGHVSGQAPPVSIAHLELPHHDSAGLVERMRRLSNNGRNSPCLSELSESHTPHDAQGASPDLSQSGRSRAKTWSHGVADEHGSDSSSDDWARNTEAKLTKMERIQTAISEHAGTRHRAIVKGRLLRLLRSGMAPGGHGSLSRKDLDELAIHLPKLPKPDSPPGKLEQHSAGKADRNKQISSGWMQNLSSAAQQALRRKHRQLSSQPYSAVVPSISTRAL